MEAYKFETTIQKDGIIRIPEIAQLADQQVEVFIIVKPKPQLETDKQPSIKDFLDRWRGAVQNADPDELKSQYLQDKYQ